MKPMIFLLLLAAHPAAADAITLSSQDQLDWHTTPEGVAFAPLHGDRFIGTYQAMVELPAGTISPLHTKSANMFGVLIQGEMAHYSVSDDPATAPKIGPGSFYKIPAGLPHISACVSETPCVTYLYQDGAFDFVPVSQ